MNTARHPLFFACFSGAIAWSRAAHAGDADAAQASFDRGVAQMEAGRYDEACPAIEESYKLEVRPGTLFTLAECEVKRGRLATALGRYDEYLALYASLPAPQKRKQGGREKEARTQRAALARDVPEIKLLLPPDAPTGTVVERDGVVVPSAALGVATAVDPGEHAITTRAPGGTTIDLRVRIGRGETKTITLEAKAAAPPATPPPAPEARPAQLPDPSAKPSPAPPIEGQGPSGRRIGAYVAGGLGIAGLVAGGVTGALAIAKKGVVDANCEGLACNHTGKTAADDLKTLGLISTLGFGAAIAGIGAATALLLTEPGTKQPSGAGAAQGRGRWMTAAVMPMSSGGAALELRGAW